MIIICYFGLVIVVNKTVIEQYLIYKEVIWVPMNRPGPWISCNTWHQVLFIDLLVLTLY